MSGDQDLVNLRSGDDVSGNALTTVTQYVADTDDTSTAATKTGATYRILGSDIWADYIDTETVELDDLFGNAVWNMIWWEHSSSTSADGTAIASRGPTESATVASWKTAIQDNLYYSFSYYGQTTTDADTSLGPVGADVGTINFTKPVSITSVLTSTNTVVVSGGNWSNGDTVSAALAAGVGTVTSFDSTANTIDYTLTGGRFIGGESKVATVLTNSYGTNGFRLPFTPGDLGKDSFGSNDWTPNNFTDASVVDSPTNYGTDTGVGNEVRGNYAVWSGLDHSPSLVPANGGTKVSFAGSVATYGTIRSTLHLGDGKYYWETTSTANRTYSYHGIMRVDQQLVDGTSSAIGYLYPGSAAVYLANGRMTQDANYSSPTNRSVGEGDIIGHAYDATTGKYWYSINNVFLGDPAAGTGEDANLDVSHMWAPAISEASSGTTTTNFGQKDFQYDAPTGFKTLNTHNL